MLFIIIRTPVCNVMLARRAITTHTNSIYLYAFLFNVIYTYNTYIPTPICVLYYMYTCKYIGICTRIFRKNTPSFLLPLKIRPLTHKADLTVRITALLLILTR